MDMTWKGLTASGFGIYVTALPPIESAGRRDTPFTVPRKSGSVHVQDGSRDDIVKRVDLYMPYEQGVGVTALRAVMNWLSGSGELILSDEPERYYNARIVNAVDYSPWVTGFDDRIVEVYFECEPFAYHLYAEPAAASSSGTQLRNPGLAEARPLIQCSGFGDVKFTIAGTEFTLTDIAGSADTSARGSLYVDCRDMECYSQTEQGARTSRNYRMIGAFPAIPPGDFTVSWQGLTDDNGHTGLVTGVTLSPPRWCD